MSSDKMMQRCGSGSKIELVSEPSATLAGNISGSSQTSSVRNFILGKEMFDNCKSDRKPVYRILKKKNLKNTLDSMGY